MAPRVPFEQLPSADLVVGAIYEQGPHKNVLAEPLNRLLPGVGNQGGFRAAGSQKRGTVRFAVLFTLGNDPDWPDRLDVESGLFTYFGDNKEPGAELHATSRSGNRLLRYCFDALHGEPPQRTSIPPFFLFSKAEAGGGRDARFLGVAIPGSQESAPGADLVALWRTKAGERFQNYRAIFTVLDIASVPRSWIDELASGETLGPSCPDPFRRFVTHGTYQPLRAPRTQQWRSPADQRPVGVGDTALLALVFEHFRPQPHAFEACAIELWRMLAKEAVTSVEGTRQSVDGGRDGIGLYSIGPEGDRIHLDFSLEAKCYAPDNLVGVRDLARLISRLRHRQFGVFVTTSGLGPQAYQELREDGHPVVVICGRDIVEILRQRGLGTPEAVTGWLAATFPVGSHHPSKA